MVLNDGNESPAFPRWHDVQVELGHPELAGKLPPAGHSGGSPDSCAPKTGAYLRLLNTIKFLHVDPTYKVTHDQRRTTTHHAAAFTVT